MISLAQKPIWSRIMFQVTPGASFVVIFWANTAHILIFCRVSKKAWKTTEWWDILKNLKGAQTIDIVHAMEKIMNRSNFERFCIKLWGIWND